MPVVITTTATVTSSIFPSPYVPSSSTTSSVTSSTTVSSSTSSSTPFSTTSGSASTTSTATPPSHQASVWEWFLGHLVVFVGIGSGLVGFGLGLAAGLGFAFKFVPWLVSETYMSRFTQPIGLSEQIESASSPKLKPCASSIRNAASTCLFVWLPLIS
jgi:hypothetical protein